MRSSKHGSVKSLRVDAMKVVAAVATLQLLFGCVPNPTVTTVAKSGYEFDSSICGRSRATMRGATKAWQTAWPELVDRFGLIKMRGELPFSAVELPNSFFFFGYLPKGSDGGVAEITVCKDTGRIANIGHGK
jgi:hypothetical protein